MAHGTDEVGSDVNLLVEFLPDARVGLFEMGALKEDLEEQLGCQVDLVSRAGLERSRNVTGAPRFFVKRFRSMPGEKPEDGAWRNA